MYKEQVNRAKEAPDYIIDDDTGALINTNDRALQGYRAQRQQMRNVQKSMNRLDALEESVNRIEQLLIKVLEK